MIYFAYINNGLPINGVRVTLKLESHANGARLHLHGLQLSQSAALLHVKIAILYQGLSAIACKMNTNNVRPNYFWNENYFFMPVWFRIQKNAI